jgi:hypothetical protein
MTVKNRFTPPTIMVNVQVTDPVTHPTVSVRMLFLLFELNSRMTLVRLNKGETTD